MMDMDRTPSGRGGNLPILSLQRQAIDRLRDSNYGKTGTTRSTLQTVIVEYLNNIVTDNQDIRKVDMAERQYGTKPTNPIYNKIMDTFYSGGTLEVLCSNVRKTCQRYIEAVDKMALPKGIIKRAENVRRNLKMALLAEMIYNLELELHEFVSGALEYVHYTSLSETDRDSDTEERDYRIRLNKTMTIIYGKMAKKYYEIIKELISYLKEISAEQEGNKEVSKEVLEFTGIIDELNEKDSYSRIGKSIVEIMEIVETVDTTWQNLEAVYDRLSPNKSSLDYLNDCSKFGSVLERSLSVISGNISALTLSERSMVNQIVSDPDSHHDSEKYYLKLYKKYNLKSYQKTILEAMSRKINEAKHSIIQDQIFSLREIAEDVHRFNKSVYSTFINTYSIYSDKLGENSGDEEEPESQVQNKRRKPKKAYYNNRISNEEDAKLSYAAAVAAVDPDNTNYYTITNTISGALTLLFKNFENYYTGVFPSFITDMVKVEVENKDKEMSDILSKHKDKRYIRYLKSGISDVTTTSVTYVDSDEKMEALLEGMVARFESDKAKFAKKIKNKETLESEDDADKELDLESLEDSVWECGYVEKLKEATKEYASAVKKITQTREDGKDERQTLRKAHIAYMKKVIGILGNLNQKMRKTLGAIQKEMAENMDESMISTFIENVQVYVKEMQNGYLYSDVMDLYKYRIKRNSGIMYFEDDDDYIYTDYNTRRIFTDKAKIALGNIRVIIKEAYKDKKTGFFDEAMKLIRLLDIYMREEIFSIYINKNVLNDFYSVAKYNTYNKDNADNEEALEKKIKEIRDVKGMPFERMQKIFRGILQDVFRIVNDERLDSIVLRSNKLFSYDGNETELANLIKKVMDIIKTTLEQYEKFYKAELETKKEKEEKDDEDKSTEAETDDEEDEEEKEKEKKEKETKAKEINEVRELGYSNEVETTFMGSNHVSTTPITAKFKVNGSNLSITVQGLPAQANNYKYRIIPIFEGVKTEKAQVVQNGTPINFVFDKELEGKEIGAHIYIWKDETKPISQIHPDEYVADAQINMIPRKVLELIADKTMNDKFEDYTQMKTGDNQGNKPIENAGIRVFRIDGNLYVKLWREMNGQMANKLNNICGGPNQTLPEGENRYTANKYGDKLGYIIPVKGNISAIIQNAMSVHLYNEKLEANNFYGYGEPKIEIIDLNGNEQNKTQKEDDEKKSIKKEKKDIDKNGEEADIEDGAEDDEENEGRKKRTSVKKKNKKKDEDEDEDKDKKSKKKDKDEDKDDKEKTGWQKDIKEIPQKKSLDYLSDYDKDTDYEEV